MCLGRSGSPGTEAIAPQLRAFGPEQIPAAKQLASRFCETALGQRRADHGQIADQQVGVAAQEDRVIRHPDVKSGRLVNRRLQVDTNMLNVPGPFQFMIVLCAVYPLCKRNEASAKGRSAVRLIELLREPFSPYARRKRNESEEYPIEPQEAE